MNLSHEALQDHLPLPYSARTIDVTLAQMLLGTCEHLLSVRTVGWSNLEKTQEHLISGSAVLAFNHSSSLDIPYLYERVLKKLNATMTTGPAAAKFYEDPYRGIQPIGELTNEILEQARTTHQQSTSLFEGRIVTALTKLRNVKPVPLVQHYLLGEESVREFNIAFDTAMLCEIANRLCIPGTVVGIAPEGHRSENGKLQAAQSGITPLFRNRRNRDSVIIQPIGLIGLASIYKPRRRLENLLGKTTLVIGPSCTYSDISTEAREYGISFHDAIMCRLAALLPPTLHGYYEDKKFHAYIDMLQGQDEYAKLLLEAGIKPRSGIIFSRS